MTKHPFLVPPPVWLIAAGGVQHAVAGRRRPTRASKVLAAALAAAAGGLACSAILTFLRAGTTIDPEHPQRASVLVTEGPFRYTRNPMYVALTGVLLAHAMLRRSLLAIAPVIGFVAVIDLVQIPAEERALRARFGRRYDRYRRETPRWMGRSPRR